MTSQGVSLFEMSRRLGVGIDEVVALIDAGRLRGIRVGCELRVIEEAGPALQPAIQPASAVESPDMGEDHHA